MKPIPFVKVVGSGNDFILVDNRGRSPRAHPAALAKAWCDRKHGIGADGLLWIASSPRAQAHMRIFNPDGSEASMCGNGLRCVVWYLHTKNHRQQAWRVQTRAGILPALVVAPERIRIFLPPPQAIHLGLSIVYRGKRYPLHSVNTGVPHAILFISKWTPDPLATLGPFIRHHRLFKPHGANVNLVRIESPHRIALRTYERGVEAETLACGTGAVAAAVIGTALGRLKPPIQVLTTGGERLKVGFRQTRSPWKELYLEGTGRILFTGTLPHA